MIKSINRTDISKKIAKDLGLTIKQTQEIAEETELALVEFLREREQVRIHEFGTFYQTMIKSHVIKQIRTKTPRIILEQKTVKFRPSPIFKDAIYGRTPRTRALAPELRIKNKELRINTINKGNIAVNYQPTPPKPEPKKITFKPFALHQRVEKDDIQSKIKERWLSAARSQVDEPKQREIIREAQIFIKLLGQMKNTGITSLDFSYESLREIKIFAGRPRHQVSHLPREVVKGFLSYLDLEDFHTPQQRHKLIFVDNTKYDKINIGIHSLPTQRGASIHIDIK